MMVVLASLSGRLAECRSDRIAIDFEAIAADYANKLAYIRGQSSSITSMQKRFVFLGVDIDAFYMWLEANGGVSTYGWFIIEHERAHKNLGHTNPGVYPIKDLLSARAIGMEMDANNAAFSVIGYTP